MTLDTTIVVALIAALAGAVSAVPATIIAVRRFPVERQRIKAETVATWTRAQAVVIDNLREENKDLRREQETYAEAIKSLQQRDRDMQRQIKELEKELAHSNARNVELEAQIRQLRQENAELRTFYEKANNLK